MLTGGLSSFEEGENLFLGRYPLVSEKLLQKSNLLFSDDEFTVDEHFKLTGAARL